MLARNTFFSSALAPQLPAPREPEVDTLIFSHPHDMTSTTRADELRAFLEALPGMRCAEDLCSLLCERVGLFRDNRPIYGEFARFQRDRGLWQDPRELATFLWESRAEFRRLGVRSFLEVGTFQGYTFFVVLHFLRTFVNEAIVGTTVDVTDEFLDPDLLPFLGESFVLGDSASVSSSASFDLVFIDAVHTYEGVSTDYANVGRHAKAAFFHDVNDRHCPGVRAWWKEHAGRNDVRTTEFFLAAAGDVFGIGLSVPGRL